MTRKDESLENGFTLADGSVCPARRHQNTDGSVGGWVPVDMLIPEDVFLDATVIVHPGVVISPGAKIFGPCQLMAE